MIAPKTHRIDRERLVALKVEFAGRRLCDITSDLVRAYQCGVVLNGDGGDVSDLCEGLKRLEAEHDALGRAAAIERNLSWESQLETVARIAGACR